VEEMVWAARRRFLSAPTHKLEDYAQIRRDRPLNIQYWPLLLAPQLNPMPGLSVHTNVRTGNSRVCEVGHTSRFESPRPRTLTAFLGTFCRGAPDQG